MEHSTASKLLTESGELDLAQTKALGAHVATCRECRSWVATYQFFAEALGEDPAAARHPSSKDLCSFALAGTDLDATTRDRCHRHIENCPECSYEIELVRSAVSESSVNVALEWPTSRVAERLSHKAGALALAATLAILLGGLLVVSRVLSPESKEYRMAGLLIQETEAINAEGPIFVESTQIQEGATLALRSPVVTFGDGFSVDSGAGLIVGEGNPPLAASK